MRTGSSQPGAALLPVRPIRAGMLAFFSALAFIEVGAGAVVAEAWRLQRSNGYLLPDDRWQLDHLLERLRVMEGVVAAGATATAILWSFLAVHNAARAGRNTRRTAVLAMAAWVVAPVGLIISRASDHGTHSTATGTVILALQAFVLYVPFGASAKMTDSVGGPRLPFLRWYLTVAAAFAVHHVFTGALVLADPQSTDDFGRTAMLYLINAVVVGVMAVMAAEASRSMQAATEERAWQVRVLQDDAHQRLRGSMVPSDAGTAVSTVGPVATSGQVPTLPAPSLPMAISVVPASMGPVVAAALPTLPAPPAPAPVAAPSLPLVSPLPPLVPDLAAVSVPVVAAAPATPAPAAEPVAEPMEEPTPALVSFPMLVAVGAPAVVEGQAAAPAAPSAVEVVPAPAATPDPVDPASLDAVSGLPSLKFLMGNS